MNKFIYPKGMEWLKTYIDSERCRLTKRLTKADEILHREFEKGYSKKFLKLHEKCVRALNELQAYEKDGIM